MRRAYLTVVVSTELLLITREAKITELDRPVLIYENVLTLQITVEKTSLVQIQQSHGNLLGYLRNPIVVENDPLRVQKVKQTSFVDELSDHVEVVSFKAYTHVHNNIWMPQLVQHLNLFNEVFERFLRQVALAESLDSHFGPKPPSLVDVSVATTADEV